VTLHEAKAALERGRHVVLVTPPAVEQAGELWELLPPGPPGPVPGSAPPVLIVCADDASAAEWAAAAPTSLRVHALTGLSRTIRLLKESAVRVLAGAAKDIAALVARSALKLDGVSTIVLAWPLPEALAEGEQATVLDALLGEAREARRIVLSWNPAALDDFLERHARRALVVGALPVDAAGAPLRPIAAARRSWSAALPPRRRSCRRRGRTRPPGSCVRPPSNGSSSPHRERRGAAEGGSSGR